MLAEKERMLAGSIYLKINYLSLKRERLPANQQKGIYVCATTSLKAGPGLNRLRSDHAINSEYPGNAGLLAECVKSYRERQLQNQQVASVPAKMLAMKNGDVSRGT
jgi:hypothetical protein